MIVIGDKREVVAAAAFQFSSDMRRLKEHSLAQVFLGILYRGDHSHNCTIQYVTDAYRSVTKGGYISIADAEQVLLRLQQQRRVRIVSEPQQHFELTDAARRELQGAEAEAERSLSAIAAILFPSSIQNSTIYEDPFIEIVSKVAAELGEESTSYLLRRQGASPLSSASLEEWIEEAASSDKRIDRATLKHGVLEFFRSPDSQCQSLLWRITEAYFVTRMLGIHPGGQALSHEVFQKWEFVIDTNVLIGLLFPADESHEVAFATVKAIQSLNRPMVVLDSTINETLQFIERDLSLLERYVERGDDRWLTKTNSPVLREYARGKWHEVGHFRKSLASLRETLVQRYGIRIVSDDLRLGEESVMSFARGLQLRYQQWHRGARQKNAEVACHDARLLLHVHGRRETSAMQCWAITLDSSLPNAVPPDSGAISLAVVPRTLMQWLSPLVHLTPVADEFPRAFSELVRDRFIPSSHFMDAGDLGLLLDSWETIKELPDEDVERVLLKIQAESVRIDPGTAEGREHVTGIIASVVSNPSSRLQVRMHEVENRWSKEISSARERADQLEREKDQQISQLRTDLQAVTQGQERAVHRAENLERTLQLLADRPVARRRFLLGGVLTVALTAVIAWAVLDLYTAQHLPNWMPVWAGWMGVFIVEIGIASLALPLLLRRLVGEHRIYSLSPPIRKYLGEG